MTEVLGPDRLDLTGGGADELAAGLRDYVALVAAALGVGQESCAIDPCPPASAYIALDARLPSHPQRDLALLWDERHGWSAGVETHSSEDLIVVAYQGGDLVPPPAAVRAFAEAVVAGLPVGRTDPPALTSRHATLTLCLRGYTTLRTADPGARWSVTG